MAAPTNTIEFLDIVRRSGLLNETLFREHFPDDRDLPEEAPACAATLVKARLLTPFQARHLLAGKYAGLILGQYKLINQIGQGGMGTVYLAEHRELGRLAALKVLPPEKAKEQLAVERFKREARAAAALDHPNIVKVFDVFHTGGLHFMVMEYVAGKDLQTVVKESGPIHFATAIAYTIQAATGLQYAHEKGFVHRDIKPANLILSKEGVVKLLDLGLARSFDARDQLTEQLDKQAIVGTADFVSPEQALGEGQDHRGDIYSLGCSLYALVSGVPPFKGHTTQLLMQHQMAPPPRLSKRLKASVPVSLDSVIAKMMAKKPLERYQSAEEVIEALTPFISSESSTQLGQVQPAPAAAAETVVGLEDNSRTTTDSRLHTVRPGKNWLAKNRLPVAAGALVTVALLVGGLSLAFSGKSQTPTVPGPHAGQPSTPTGDSHSLPNRPSEVAAGMFARDNLVPWCIVPFDAKKRTPAQRVEMLQRLGFKKFAYDWRADQLSTFDEEVALLKKAGIELTAVWFPVTLNPDAHTILSVLKKYGVKTQLWVTMNEPTGTDNREKVDAVAKTIRPIADEAAAIGCSVGLYSHQGWGRNPDNLIAVVEQLKLKNVGIVYSMHHGHEHIDRFAELFRRMQPHLLAINLNGMTKGGSMILPLGQGESDAKLLRIIAESGYKGPIGILGHSDHDVEDRLSDNLDGLAWLIPQLTGKAAGPKPRFRTSASGSGPAVTPSPTGLTGWVARGKPEYRSPPLTVEARVMINPTAMNRFNIIVASDSKLSASHWELFTWGGGGYLTAYLPGMNPDHVRSKHDICDGKWHTVAMHYEAKRVRLYVDGQVVADDEVERARTIEAPGDITFAKLVAPADGPLGLDGDLERVKISKGIVPLSEKELQVDDETIGLWTFIGRDKPAEDSSKQKNNAKPAPVVGPVGAAPNGAEPAAGLNLAPTDPKLKAVLIDRSPNEAYMAVKVDGAGQVFVGGREKVFVFESDGKGGFGERQELCKFPPDSIIIGLEFRGDDLYVLASHGLYLVPGGRVKREGLAPQRILWGVPLDYHVSFHCLAWGPDGDLYLDHGDPLLNTGDWERHDHWGHWTLFGGPKEEKTNFTGNGAVLKVRPDGSNPRVVARGFRGPVGLAFDHNWNLFTNDNDHEGRPDLFVPMRLLHVTQSADYGWPRGWMASKNSDRADLPDSVHPALGRGVPCDLAYYDEPAVPSLRGSLLMCRWDRFAVTHYPLQSKGASFTSEELVFAQGSNQCRPTGVTVDGSGRVFVTGLYLSGNVVSPNCASDLVMILPTEEGALRAPLNEYTATVDQLWTALNGTSWDDRRRAHAELIRRKEPLAQALARLRTIRNDEPAAAHLPWLAAIGGPDATAKLAELAGDTNQPVLRLHSLRALASFPVLKPPAHVFAVALSDPSPAIRLAGLEGFLGGDFPIPVDAVAKLAGSSDPVLRQTAANVLARRASVDDIERQAKSYDDRTRLGSVLAAGIRLTVPKADAPAPEGVKLHLPGNGGFFNGTLRFADSAEPVELAKLGPIGSYTIAQRWAAATKTAEEERLFKLLMAALDDRDNLVRLQAAHYLAWLRDPRSEPVIAKVRTEGRTHGLKDQPAVAVKEVWRIGRISEASAGQAIERGPIDLTATTTVGTAKLVWETSTAGAGGVPLPAGAGNAYVYFRLHSRNRQPALLAGVPHGTHLWQNARTVAPEKDGSYVLDLDPGSNDLLLRVAGTGPLNLDVRTRSAVSVGLPEKTDGAMLAERLKSATGPAAIPAEFLNLDWTTEGRKGDAVKGRILFGSLGCAKCHAIAADQTGGGAPSLAEAGKRFTAAHLAESILLPDRQVTDQFRSTRIVTAAGQTFIGLVVRETDEELELLLPDTKREVIKVKGIETRKQSPASPMPGGLVKTPDELRNLLAYLLSDNPLPP